jgi:GNAT superfamily N-acetyltransferase
MSGGAGLVVRPARTDDVATVGAIHVRSWQAAYADAMPTEWLAGLDPADRAAMWARALEPGARTRLLVAEQDGRVVGFAAVAPAHDDEVQDDAGDLLAIYLEPEVIGTGVGRELIAGARAALVEQGFDSAMLWVLESNDRARRFYERDGWTFDGGRSDYEVGDAHLPIVRYRRTL